MDLPVNCSGYFFEIKRWLYKLFPDIVFFKPPHPYSAPMMKQMFEGPSEYYLEREKEELDENNYVSGDNYVTLNQPDSIHDTWVFGKSERTVSDVPAASSSPRSSAL